jgi:hypothetical protein
VLLFKIVLAPILIAVVSLASRKWGPSVAGWLLGLPLNSGPILFFLLFEQGRGFTLEATRSSLLGILAWAAFCLTYAFCCIKLPWWWSTLAGWSAYCLVAWILLPVKLSVTWAFVLVTVAIAGILLSFPKPSQPDAIRGAPPRDLWLRMLSASVMVVTLTSAAKALGPTRSGILSAFPAYTTILAVFSQRHGPASAVKAMKGVTAGLFTAATFFLALSISMMRFSGARSFGVATAAALLVQAVSLLFIRRNG